MKILKTLLVVLFIILCFRYTYSQQDSITKKIIFRKDTLTIGKYYSFFVKLGEPIMGKLLTLEEDKFIVYVNKDMEEIDTGKVINILIPTSYLYGEYNENKVKLKNKTRYFFGAGYAITKKNSSSSINYSNGFNITANSLLSLNNSMGVRIDFDYNHIENAENIISYLGYAGNTTSYSYSGGTLNNFLIRSNLAIGSMSPKDAFQYYFLPAIGTGVTFTTGENITYYENGVPTITHGTRAEATSFSIGVSLGFGLNVKLSNKIRGFAEYQYNAWYIGETGPPVYSTVKLGIIL